MSKDYVIGLHQDRHDRWEMTVLLSADGYAENRDLALIELGRQRTEEEALAVAEYTLNRQGWERTTDWSRTEWRMGALLAGPSVSYRAATEPRGRHTYTLNNGLYGACDCHGAMLSQAPIPDGLAEHPIVSAHTATYGDVYLVQDHPDRDPHRECEHFTVVV